MNPLRKTIGWYLLGILGIIWLGHTEPMMTIPVFLFHLMIQYYGKHPLVGVINYLVGLTKTIGNKTCNPKVYGQAWQQMVLVVRLSY